MVRVISGNDEIVPDTVSCFELRALQPLCRGVGQEPGFGAHHQVVEIHVEDFRLVGQAAVRGGTLETGFVALCRLRVQYVGLVVRAEIESCRFEDIPIISVKHRFSLAIYPNAIADAKRLRRANVVPARLLCRVLPRRCKRPQGEIAGELAIAGLVETYARDQVPARIGLPVELHILPGKEAFIAHVADFVDR